MFVDLDGVLADFDKAACKVLGTTNPYKFDFVYGTEEFWRRLNAVPDFFASFDPMPDAFELWGHIEHLDPIILTALPRSGADEVDRQKRDWVARNFGSFTRVITCLTKEKPDYCQPRDILIDDRAINRDAWNARGGDFVLHTSGQRTISELYFLGVIG